MALTFGFYNSVSGDRKYDADQMSQLFEGIIKDGVFQGVGTAFATTAAGGLNISVGTGRAWFNNTWTNNDSAFSLTLPTAFASLNRYDTVVLTVDKNEAVRANTIEIVSGTGSAGNPAYPSLLTVGLKRQYPLAHIYRAANNNTIVQSNITYNVGTPSCPVVTAPLQALSIESIMNQLQGAFEDWFDNLSDMMDENAEVNMGARIIALEDDVEEIQQVDTQQNVDIVNLQSGLGTLAGNLNSSVTGLNQSITNLNNSLLAEINKPPSRQVRGNTYNFTNLGTSITPAQLTAIRNGSFITESGQAMWIGSYWDVGGVRYTIAHFDYFYQMAGGWPDNQHTSHHIVLVPSHSGTNTPMYNTANGGGRGYVTSLARTTVVPALAAVVNTALRNNALRQTGDMLSSNEGTGVLGNFEMFRYSFLGCLMNDRQVFGTNLTNYNSIEASCYGNRQFALFRLAPHLIKATNNQSYWLRTPTGVNAFAAVSHDGLLQSATATTSRMMRPYFIVG